MSSFKVNIFTDKTILTKIFSLVQLFTYKTSITNWPPCKDKCAKRYLPSIFCPQLSLLPKANVGGISCESKGGLDAQDSAKWQQLFSMSGAWKLGSFYTNQNPWKGLSINPETSSSSSSLPHPPIFTIMHTHCHKSNALSWSVGAEYIKRVCRICIQTYLF